jgi:hypothetical protein
MQGPLARTSTAQYHIRSAVDAQIKAYHCCAPLPGRKRISHPLLLSRLLLLCLIFESNSDQLMIKQTTLF